MPSRLRWSALLLLSTLAAMALPGATSAAEPQDVTIAIAPPVTVDAASAPSTAEAALLRPLPTNPTLLEDAFALGADAAARSLVLPPRPQPSPFEGAQVVSFYGYPGVPVMGALGAYDPTDAIAAVADVAAEYDALNGSRGVLPALHLIVAVAQAAPGDDGIYLERMDRDLLFEYVEAAREHQVLLFLDVQVGWSDVLMEVGMLADALREPFVHLALDPEFATLESGAAPGVVIGSLKAEEVNAVQTYLASLVDALQLPPKVLVLHQFMDHMLTETEDFADVPQVELSVDMDGFGGDGAKLSKYERFALSQYSERPAIKLFFDWDAPLITPERLLALERPPDLVIYQ